MLRLTEVLTLEYLRGVGCQETIKAWTKKSGPRGRGGSESKTTEFTRTFITHRYVARNTHASSGNVSHRNKSYFQLDTIHEGPAVEVGARISHRIQLATQMRVLGDTASEPYQIVNYGLGGKEKNSPICKIANFPIQIMGDT